MNDIKVSINSAVKKWLIPLFPDTSTVIVKVFEEKSGGFSIEHAKKYLIETFKKTDNNINLSIVIEKAESYMDYQGPGFMLEGFLKDDNYSHAGQSHRNIAQFIEFVEALLGKPMSFYNCIDGDNDCDKTIRCKIYDIRFIAYNACILMIVVKGRS